MGRLDLLSSFGIRDFESRSIQKGNKATDAKPGWGVPLRLENRQNGNVSDELLKGEGTKQPGESLRIAHLLVDSRYEVSKLPKKQATAAQTSAEIMSDCWRATGGSIR